MPLFFYVGGYSHLVAWRRAQAKGEHLGSFVLRRLRGLAVPTLSLLGVWIALGIALGAIFNLRWIGRAVFLVVSPLWFMGVYLMLIALLPVFLWLHERWDTVVLVFLAAIAGAVDIIRFRYGYEWLGIVNMIAVWALCHQLGFFYERLVHAARRADWTLLWAGLAALCGLVASGLYPGSMVGVPGETSNMAPPTLCIVALVAFQAGVAEVLRPRVELRLQRPRWQRSERDHQQVLDAAVPLPHHRHGVAPCAAVAGNRSGNANPHSAAFCSRSPPRSCGMELRVRRGRPLPGAGLGSSPPG